MSQRQKDINKHATCISNSGKLEYCNTRFASVTCTVGLRRTLHIIFQETAIETKQYPCHSYQKPNICVNTFLKNIYTSMNTLNNIPGSVGQCFRVHPKTSSVFYLNSWSHAVDKAHARADTFLFSYIL